jgi:hypothetical protein
MNFSRPAAVFAAVLTLAAGTAVAVNAATQTHPVKLCSNNLTRIVSVPNSAGNCAGGNRTFYVAEDADVKALATRVDQLEAPARITLDPRLSAQAPDQVVFDFVATGLKPGSDLTSSYFTRSSGELEERVTVLGKADAAGNFTSNVILGCPARYWRLEGVTPSGALVHSEAIEVSPQCRDLD